MRSLGKVRPLASMCHAYHPLAVRSASFPDLLLAGGQEHKRQNLMCRGKEPCSILFADVLQQGERLELGEQKIHSSKPWTDIFHSHRAGTSDSFA